MNNIVHFLGEYVNSEKINFLKNIIYLKSHEPYGHYATAIIYITYFISISTSQCFDQKS